MSVKAFLLVAASILVAAPDLAAAKTKHHSASRSSDPIVNHSGGPISYAELLQMHGSGGSSGYNARGKRRSKTTTLAPEATVSAPTDAAPAPSPPAATLTPGTVNPPAVSVSPPSVTAPSVNGPSVTAPSVSPPSVTTTPPQ